MITSTLWRSAWPEGGLGDNGSNRNTGARCLRGFPRSEFADRCARAQKLMAEHGLAALLLTTEPEVRYFTGYLTRFWESPTRP
ncbi:MAG: hypothetical protein HKO04_04995, partial [Silicimonas sp.]|nr:hypothetical protein [Silicimonas sp.]